MADTDALEVRDDAQWELVFVMDGIHIAFCSHRHLEALSTGEGHTMRRGLVRDGMTRRLEIDMRQGPLVPQTMRVKIQDFEGDLAELFAADRDDFEYLDLTIDPGDDLTTRTNLHGMHVGTERIGPGGERRQYPAPLGDTLGRQHYAGNLDSQLGATPTYVSSAPLSWVGRRCVLYRVYRDHITYPDDYSQGWRPASEWRRIWWGSMRDDGQISGRLWSLECDGPDSWTRKDLGLLTQRTPVGISPLFAYAAEEAEGAGWIGSPTTGDSGFVEFGTVFTSTTFEGLRSEFAALVAGIASDAGEDGPWNDWSGNVLTTLGAGRTVGIRWSDQYPAATSYVVLYISLHRRMWERLGWDLLQSESLAEYEHGFQDLLPLIVMQDTGEPPSDGYVVLRVRVFEQNLPIYEVSPRFEGGVAPLDPTRIDADGQVINLSPNTSGQVTHDGQLFAPVASDPADATAGYDLPDGPECDTQGFFLLQGERRFAGQEDVFNESAVVQCSWVDQQGTVLNNQVVATRLWGVRRFGIDRPKLSSTWSQQVNGIQARPILYLGYQHAQGYDLAHLVMQRMLLATGTSQGWSSFADDLPITSDPGDNDPPILAGFVRLDTERADLGLAIPRDMVQSPAQWQAAAQTAEDEAIEVFVAIEPGTNAEDVFEGLMRPLGFAWSLAGGRYGIFTPHDPIDESEVQWVLTRAQQQRVGWGINEPDQDLREYAPVDSFDLQWSKVPYEDDFLYSAKVDAADAGRRYRPGGISESIDAPYHRRRTAGSKGLRGRLSNRASFWSRRHYTVHGFDVVPSIGRRIWPGEGARITHPLLIDPVATTYGVTARRARILAVEEDLGRDTSAFKVDFLAYAERTTTPKVHAPVARGYGFDSDSDTILVYDDCLGLGSGWSDAAAFVEPTYVGIEQYGGDLDIHWWQWDGTGWSATGSGRVQSVTTTPGSASITVSDLSGTYYPCQDAIVLPGTIDNQTAEWGLALFVAVGDEGGTTAAGDNQRFEDV